uniref:Uncharacterized protein n=1 Tax=Parascaris univalens TaxID=6257 RepID=A0A915A6R6_PARUN
LALLHGLLRCSVFWILVVSLSAYLKIVMFKNRRETFETVMFRSGLLVPAKVLLTASGDISRGKWSGHFSLSTNQLGSFPRNKIKCLCKYKYKRMVRLAVDAVDKQHKLQRVRIRVPDGAIGSTKVIVISGDEWAEVTLMKETEERLFRSEQKLGGSSSKG